MKIDFEKYTDQLVPAIVQDSETGNVLMLGFMNAEAFEKTRKTNKVTFFSRSRQRLWTKGETSGNFLAVKDILPDCDGDTILIKAKPAGAVCHTGADTCFGEGDRRAKIHESEETDAFLFELERVILSRKGSPAENSYTARLFAGGINRIAQKVGEEAVELIIEAKDERSELFLNEAADLIYHFMVLLAAKNVKLRDVLLTLEKRKR